MGTFLILGLFVVYRAALLSAYRPCAQKTFKSSENNIVCVCNSTYCDEIEPAREIPAGNAILYTSSRSGKRFERSSVPISEGTANSDVTITVDARKSHQSIIGFGGAFTDAVGINLRSLSEQTQKKLLESYFGKNGKYLYSMCGSLDLLLLNDSID